MITSLRTSTIRLITGAGLGLAGIAVFLFLLPDASQKLVQKTRALAEAAKNQKAQKEALDGALAEAGRMRANRDSLDALMKNMPIEPVGRLHWRLSSRLHDLAQKEGVRLVAVKYGAAAHEGTKGSQLESVDEEFTVTGVYSNLKGFMLALESSKLPFAVVNAKLDESPEGAHLTVTLRAFRQTGAAPADAHGDNS
jgi:hypothetical protein